MLNKQPPHHENCQSARGLLAIGLPHVQIFEGSEAAKETLMQACKAVVPEISGHSANSKGSRMRDSNGSLIMTANINFICHSCTVAARILFIVFRDQSGS